MAHPSSWRGTDTSNKAYCWLILLVLALEKFCSVFFCATTNFANHDNALGFVIFHEYLQAIDEVCAAKRVPSNTDHERLAKASFCSLVDSFVGQSA